MENPIAELKAIIKAKCEAKIKKIQDEMEEEFSFLSRLEKTLSEETAIKNNSLETSPFSTEKSIRHIKTKRKWRKIHDLTAGKRVEAALKTMDGEFSSRELKEKASNDGYGKEIKRGTFAGIFADLLKDQKIIVLQERKGNQGGLYLKVDQTENN